ncbi:OsmC family protein [Vibrio amylolyticus]|uniref:OsmC family protein n=1 Tax=Vibrio amylolyticus TaxID=2847292 RepID=UPI00354F6824
MGIRVKPEQYGPVIAELRDNNVIYFGLKGTELTTSPPFDRPANMLLYSVASCLILSLQAVAKRKKIAIDPFYIEISAHKGAKLPIQIVQYDVVLSSSIHTEREISASLLKSAKAICTVSNSLSGQFNLSVK